MGLHNLSLDCDCCVSAPLDFICESVGHTGFYSRVPIANDFATKEASAGLWDSVVTNALSRYENGTSPSNFPPVCSLGCTNPDGWLRRAALASNLSYATASWWSFQYGSQAGYGQWFANSAKLYSIFTGSHLEDYTADGFQPFMQTRIFSHHVTKYAGALLSYMTTSPGQNSMAAQASAAYWILIFPVPNGASLQSHWGFTSLNIKLRLQMDYWQFAPYSYAGLPNEAVNYAEWNFGQSRWDKLFNQTIEQEDVDVVIGSCGGYWRTGPSGAKPANYWATHHILNQDYAVIQTITPPMSNGLNDIVDIQLGETELSIPVQITDEADLANGVPYGTAWFVAIVPKSPLCDLANTIASSGQLGLNHFGRSNPLPLPYGWLNQRFSDKVCFAAIPYCRGERSGGAVQFVGTPNISALVAAEWPC